MDESRRDDEGIPETPPNRTFGQSASDGARSDLVRTSRLAIIACVLGIVGLLLLLGLAGIVYDKRTSPAMRDACQILTYGTSLLAIVLGLISLARIGPSGGRLSGRGYAWVAVAIPVLQGFLFSVLFPILARTRCYAFTDTCGTHVSGIGKAMLIYANDYEDELPRAGGRGTTWGAMPPVGWKATDRRAAFGSATDGTGGQAGITACFYLLVKYSEVTPKSFVCKGDAGVTVFDLSQRKDVPKNFELIDGWDFGPPEEAFTHCSYAYHMPFGLYRLTTADPPGFAVAADRNPWMDSPSAKAGDFSQFRPDIPPFGGTAAQAKRGNTPCHQADGQNVLFLDSHVEFAKRAFCAVEDDNIYTISTSPTAGDPLGTPPKLGSQPANRRDSLLVNDPISTPAAAQKKR